MFVLPCCCCQRPGPELLRTEQLHRHQNHAPLPATQYESGRASSSACCSFVYATGRSSFVRDGGFMFVVEGLLPPPVAALLLVSLLWPLVLLLLFLLLLLTFLPPLAYLLFFPSLRFHHDCSDRWCSLGRRAASAASFTVGSQCLPSCALASCLTVKYLSRNDLAMSWRLRPDIDIRSPLSISYSLGRAERNTEKRSSGQH